MKILIALLLLVAAPVSAQVRPIVGSTVQTTDTSATSLLVGCAVGSTTCTGGIKGGILDVALITSGGAIGIADSVPGVTTMKLYNGAGTLFWNGVALATGASLSGTLNTIPVFTGASSVGNSIMTQSGTTITVVNTLNATTLGGTLSTASQPNVTTMTGLTSVGTIATGTWNATILGLAKGGTGVSLAATGGTSQFLRQNSAGATISVVRPALADLSDASNVAILNAANTFTAGAQAITAAAPILTLTATTGTNATYLNFVNTGGSTFVGSSSSTGAAFTNTPYSLFLYSGTTGGIDLSAANAAGAIRFYTGGAAVRWGINAAGDFTFGAAGNITESSGTPTIGSSFGTSPSIAGTDYAFRVTNGTPPNNGTVNFGHTWTTAPVCTISLATAGGGASTQTVAGTATTTTFQISHSAGGDAGGKISVLCRGF